MLDIPSISAVVVAIGVIVGLVFTVLELRNLVGQRQTDLVIRLHHTWISKEYREAWTRVLALEFENYNDFMKKHGPISSGKPASIAILMVGGFYESIGVLFHRKLIDIGLVEELLPVEMSWEKIKPIAEGWRKQVNEPRLAEWFEYLYNELQKRKQRLQQVKQQ